MSKLGDFTPDSSNANKGTARGQKMIVGSLQRSGFGRSVVVDKNGVTIGGNKTLEATAEVLGIDVEPIVVESDGTRPIVHKRTDLDLADPDPNNPARQLAYSDNLSSYYSFELDPAITMADIEAGFNFEVLDIRLPDLGELLEKSVKDLLGGGMPPEEPPPVTEVEAEKHHKKWQVKPGDVWQLNGHLIACLDCLDEANIKNAVGDSAVTFTFADPPYGINIVAANGYVGGGEAYDIPFGGVKNRIDKGLGSSDGAKPFGSKKVSGSDGAANLIEVGKYYPVVGDETTATAKQSAATLLSLYPGACHVWWGANYYTDALTPSPCWIIWDKDNTGNFADCEMAWTNQPTAARIFEHRWNGMLKASEQGQRRIHPTQKPIALARYCFENYGKPGDVILDPFLGSGISVLAAEELGDRRVIGFELEPVYISVVLERWQKMTNLQPQLINTKSING